MDWGELLKNTEGDVVEMDNDNDIGRGSEETRTDVILFGIVVTIFIGLMCNRAFRFHLKYLAFSGIYFFFGIICIPIMLFNAGDPKASKWVQVKVKKLLT